MGLEAIFFQTQLFQRSLGSVNGNSVTLGESLHAARMIGVLMGHYQAIEPGGVYVDLGESGLYFAAGESGIHHESSGTGLHHQYIATAAGTENHETRFGIGETQGKLHGLKLS